MNDTELPPNDKRGDFLYEGKAKKIYASDNPNHVVVHYKDDATAGNGEKKASIHDKGRINNTITAHLFTMLESQGVQTHFIEKLNDREQLCHKLRIFPLEFIVRNIITGSMAKRLNLPDGTVPPHTIREICYKDDVLGDPLINDDHAVALGAASYEQLQHMYSLAGRINDLLREAFSAHGIDLVDFKIEFGENADGEIVLADEITPDTCRLWDKKTGDKLDKDRFRQDLGGIEEAYIDILDRLTR